MTGASLTFQVSLFYVSWMDLLGTFSVSFEKGDNFLDFLFTFFHIKPLWNGIYSKRKENFLLWGANSFLLE